jgi:glycerol-3-phosphate acyltransferase PlsY
MPAEAAPILLIGAAYLIGAVPFGLLIGLARGVDIRQHGSRNIGATNAGRVLGRRWGFLCLALDVLKGLAPTLLAAKLIPSGAPEARDLILWLAVGVAAVLGHTFPIYLGFRGGKGVATTIGVALGIYPYFTLAMGAALLGYAAARYATGIVSVGSIALAVVFPVVVALQIALRPDVSFQQLWPLQLVATGLGLLILVRHRANIARLLKGEEPSAPANAPHAGQAPAP